MKKIIIFITLSSSNFMQHCSQTLVPHPHTLIIEACLTRGNNHNAAHDIAYIIAEYAEDPVLNASSHEYHACAYNGGWFKGGRVVVYNRQGVLVRNFKANQIKAVALSPDNQSVTVLHKAKSSDSVLFLTSHLLRIDVPTITTFSLHDNYSIACHPGGLADERDDEDDNDIHRWPDMSPDISNAHIQQFSVDQTGQLIITFNNSLPRAQLTHQHFMEECNQRLQERRRWWNNVFHSLKALEPFVSRILPSVYKTFQRTSRQ